MSGALSPFCVLNLLWLCIASVGLGVAPGLPDASSAMFCDRDLATSGESETPVLVARVFDTLEHCQASTIYAAFLALCLAGFMAFVETRRLARAVVPPAGRAPPPCLYLQSLV